MSSGSFEKETLILEPIQWVSHERGSGLLVVRTQELIDVDPSWAGLEKFELASALQSILNLLARQQMSLQQVILQNRVEGPVHRLIAICRAIEFLCEHRLIKNSSAYSWCEILKREFQWRESFVSEPLLETEIYKLTAGYANRFFGVCLLLFGLLLGAYGVVQVAKILFHPIGIEAALPLLWAATAFAAVSVARSIQALMKALLLRLSTGESRSINFCLTPISVGLKTNSLGSIEKKSFLVGWAGLASIAVMGSACLLPVVQNNSVFAAFTTLAVLAALSPFTNTPLLEVLRCFYSLSEGSEENDEGTMRWHTIFCFVWVGLFALFVFRAFNLFSEPLQLAFANRSNWSGQTIFGAVTFAWLLLMPLIAWLDDIASGTLFNDQHGLAEKIFRFRTRKNLDRPLRDAGEFTNREEWQRLPILRQVDASLRDKMLRTARVKSFSDGAYLCKKGDRSRDLCILLSGQAVVAKKDAGVGARAVAVLEEGAVFGEAGYFLSQPRTADVIALKDCVVLSLALDPQLPKIDIERFADLQMRIWFLQALHRSTMFKSLPAEALDALLFQGHVAKFAVGASIVREGEGADACYFVIQGKGRVFQRSLEISAVGAGDVIGEIALLTGGVRTASVFAGSEMITIKLDREKFWSVLSGNLPLGLAVERLAGAKLSADNLRRANNF